MKNEFKGLRHYIDIVESAQHQTDEDAASAGQTVGNIAGGAAGLAALPVRGAAAAGSWLADKAGQAWDATKQGVQNFAQGAAQGAKQGWDATSPQALATTVSQAGKPTKYPTTPDEIKAFQQSSGLKADGIMGPKTQAALAAAGIKAPAGQAAKPAAPAKPAGQAAKPAAPGAPAAPAAPAATTQTDDEGNTLVTTASGATGVLGPDGKPLANGGRVAPAQQQAAKPATAADGGPPPTPEQLKWLGGANPNDPIILKRMRSAVPNAPVAESSGYDEVQRLMSLVHHR